MVGVDRFADIPMSTLIWTTEKRKIADLKEADYNPRKMSEQEERDLEDSIDRFGQVGPLVVNIGKRENVLIGGHQRTKLFLRKGIDEVEVLVPSRELTKKEEKELNLRLNKNTGSWDFEKLKEMDLTLLLDVGFGDDDLQALFDDVDVLEDGFDVNRAIKEIKEPRTKTGEVWQLGNHRLMCGDSTDAEQVAKLMGEDLADVIYCDPPYNIGLDYNKGTEGSKQMYGGNYTSKKDKKKDEAYAGFLDLTIKNAIEHAKPNFHAFYWCDEKYIGLLQWLFRENKIDTNRVCLWIKNNSFPRPQVAFNKVYEPCIYGTRGKPYLNKSLNGLNEIMNKEVSLGNQGLEDIFDIINLWLVRRDDTQSYEHPTQKPVTLAERPLKRCSSPGNVVVDLFGGSGSTLIACEQIKRCARLMESDPIFCTVILDRFEAFTNTKAKKM